MKLFLSNNTVRIEDATRMQVEQIKAKCVFWHKADVIMGRKNRWRKVKPIVLFKDNRFPIGLIDQVTTDFPDAEVIDGRARPPERFFMAKDQIQLRPQQQKAADFLVKNIRGLVAAPTGFGKTFIIADAIFQTQTFPFLVVTGFTSALKQIRDKLQMYLDLPVGARGGGFKETAPIMIATAASASKMDTSIFRGVAFDEVHHMPASTYLKIAEAAENAYWCFGLSGTLKGRSDGLDKMIRATISERVYEVTYADAKEYLPDVKTLIVPVPIPIVEGEYTETYAPCIVRNVFRNEVIAKIARNSVKGDNIVFIYVKRKEHGKLLCSLIPGATYADRDTSMSARERLLEEPGVLIATSIFTESIDSPLIDTIVNAAAGKSEIIVRQLVGRGLRKGREGKVLHVYDFLDQNAGLYERHSTIRQRYYSTYGPVRLLL